MPGLKSVVKPNIVYIMTYDMCDIKSLYRGIPTAQIQVNTDKVLYIQVNNLSPHKSLELNEFNIKF